MPFWRKTLTGVVVINDEDVEQLDAKPQKEPKKKKKVEVVEPEEPQDEEFDIFADHKRQLTWKDHCINNPNVRLVYVLLLCIFFGLILPFILTSTALKPSSKVLDQRGYCFINDSVKFPCREFNVSEESCTNSGCCYMAPTDNPYAPICFHSEPSEYGYNILNSTLDGVFTRYQKMDFAEGNIEEHKMNRTSYRLGSDETMTLHMNFIQGKTPYGGDMWPAQMIVERGGDDIIRLTLLSPGNEEGTLLKDPTFNPSVSTSPKLDVEITENEGEAFNVTVYRFNKPDEILFRTVFGPYIIGDGFVEFTSTIPSKHVMGMGSRMKEDQYPLFEEFEEWSFNSQDPAFSNASLPSTHPFYMCWEPHTKNVHGVYLRTSTPLQIGTVPAPGFSFRALMGAFKILVMAGPSPSEVSTQFTSMVGRPALPPYWAFGFHMCRTVPVDDQEAAFREAMEGMVSAHFPLDGDCIDSRLAYPDSFAPLPEWVAPAIEEVRVNISFHFLAVTYPFLVNGSTVYQEAAAADVLLKLPNSVDYYGEISGSAVGYPDYLDENSFNDWLSQSDVVKERLNLSDGVILLSNSPLNEADVDYQSNDMLDESCSADNPKLCCKSSGYSFQVDPNVGEISQGSICWNAVHTSLDNSKHLAHHNAYGLYHTNRIHDVLKKIRPAERPVILSSSTHPGSGKFGGELSEGWGAGVAEQRRALQHVLQMSLYGITLAGAPPCGTRNETDPISDSWTGLCMRSYQMSIFFPFLMSHYELGHRPTNPPAVGNGFTFQLKIFMKLRYSLLPTLYTLAEEASRTGVPIVRSLAYEFYQDEGSLSVPDQFMVGPSLMVVPNFMNDTTDHTVDVPAYFPPGYWYNFLGGLQVTGENCTSDNTTCYNTPFNVTLNTVPTDVNVFVRGGHLLFLQGDWHSSINNTDDSRRLPYTVVAALAGDTGAFKGELYHDDGTSLLTSADYKVTKMQAQLKPGEQQLRIFRSSLGVEEYDQYCPAVYSSVVEKVVIFGLPTVESVSNTYNSTTDMKQNEITGELTIPNLNYDWCDKAEVVISWTYAK